MKIFLYGLITIIQHCVLAHGAPNPVLPSLLLSSANKFNNTPSLILPDILSCHRGLSSNRTFRRSFPPDPYPYDIPGTNINVEFFDYKEPVPEACVQICLSKATRELRRSGEELDKGIGRGCKA